MAIAIEVKDLRKTLGRGFALGEIDLSIATGELVGLIGHKGAGKTTLLHLLAGLDTPSSGIVSLCGGEVSARANHGFQGVELLRSSDMQGGAAAWPQSPIVLFDTSLPEDLVLIHSHFMQWARRAVYRENKTIVVAARPVYQDWQVYDRIILMSQGHICADVHIEDSPELVKSNVYRIRLKGAPSSYWKDLFAGCTVSGDNGDTVLTGRITDQAELHGLLTRIRDLGLPLISVNRVYPELEAALKLLLDEA